MSLFRNRVSELVSSRGLDFNRDDLGELRVLIARERDLDEAAGAQETAFGALWLVVADPLYRGDLTLDEVS